MLFFILRNLFLLVDLNQEDWVKEIEMSSDSGKTFSVLGNSCIWISVVYVEFLEFMLNFWSLCWISGVYVEFLEFMLNFRSFCSISGVLKLFQLFKTIPFWVKKINISKRLQSLLGYQIPKFTFQLMSPH